MHRSVFLALAFGLALWAFGWLYGAHVDPIARALAGVVIGIAVSSLAYGHPGSLAVATGSMSPLAFALLQSRSLAWATAALALLWVAPRLALAETQRRFTVLASLSLVAACVAGFVFAAYLDGSTAAQIASCVFAGSCLSLVTIVPVGSAVGLALRSAASAAPAPTRAILEHAASAHANAQGVSSRAKEWRALVQLADQRASLERSRASEEQRKDLDERISALVDLLAPRVLP